MDWEEHVRGLKAELDALRPLSAPSLAALDAWYDVELTFTSNAIEGNTLTRNETAIVLEKGLTVSGKPLKDHLEAIGHRDALLYVRELTLTAEPVREVDVRAIHHLVMQKVDSGEAGRYSRHQRMISGSALVLPSPSEIPGLMEAFVRSLQNAPPTPKSAFDAHERLVSIHPFSDGNGRTSRLLMNLLLLRAGYPPAVIRPEDRPAYFDALDAARSHDARESYYAFMGGRLVAALHHYLEIAQKA